MSSAPYPSLSLNSGERNQKGPAYFLQSPSVYYTKVGANFKYSRNGGKTVARKYGVLKKPLNINELNAKKEKPKESALQQSIAGMEKTSEAALEGVEISSDIAQTRTTLNETFKDCFDIGFREFAIGSRQTKCLLIYMDGAVKKDEIDGNILRPLMTDIRLTSPELIPEQKNLIEILKNTSISSNEVVDLKLMKDAVKHVLLGFCVLFIDGNQSGLAFATKGWQHRSVEDPSVEPVLRGPHDGFTEDLRVSTSLIRRRIKTPDLKMEKFEIGRLSKTEVVLAYIKGIADDKILSELRERLGRIDIDMILDSSYIEHLIEDSPLSPFPQTEVTERPDSCAEAIAGGRFVILADGSPFALIIPAVFARLLASPEDNYVRTYYATFIRLLRYAAFALALLGPSLYIAITTFHQEMIPTPLLVTIAASRAEVPFPAVVEALLMEITFDLIREAGERLPRYISQALSIVGVLVIGQTAVQAGLVSQSMVIVVSITAIASFTIPKLDMSRSVRLLRFPIMILAATLGIFGLIMGILVILIHMTSLRTYGVPYLSPFAPLTPEDWKDMVLKFPVWAIRKRLSFIQHDNVTKAKEDLMPKPPANDK